MPAVNNSSESILRSISQHTKQGDEVLEDACLSNTQDVAADTPNQDANMITTVPYSIAMPNTNEGEESSERFTPVTEKSPTPVLTELKSPTAERVVEEEEEEEMLVPCRPSSASPSRLRSAGKSRTAQIEQKVQIQAPLQKQEKIDLMGMYPKRPTPQQAMSFKELTAEFDRILKPLTQRMAGYAAAQTGQSEVYDTSGDCCHPILAAEPRNPATPPRALKIHRQRMVIKPGYTYSEPVLLDLPINPDTITQETINMVTDMALKMRPLPPRIDNYTHSPPSRHLLRPSYHCPRTTGPKRKAAPATSHLINGSFGGHTKCSSADIKM